MDVRGPQPVVLREGVITREDLAVMGGQPAADRPTDPAVASPGTRYTHYQPTARVVVAVPGTGVHTANRLVDRGRVGLVGPDQAGLDPRVEVVASPAGADALAATLYAALRAADQRGLDTIVVEGVGDDGVGRAVMDRLRRAAGPGRTARGGHGSHGAAGCPPGSRPA